MAKATEKPRLSAWIKITAACGGFIYCHILKDVCLLLREGVRDQIIEIGCALHNFRLRLDSWLPIPQSE